MAAALGGLLASSDFGSEGVAVMAGHEGGLITTGESVAQAAERALALRSELADRASR